MFWIINRLYAAVIMVSIVILLTAGRSLPGLPEGEAAPVEKLDECLVEANKGFGFSLFKMLQQADKESNLLI
ncbi:MAG: hypothetical protein SVV67_07075 [Bacillota bacterium]|nr:hypothetical protein [Bacillota bacterium]